MSTYPRAVLINFPFMTTLSTESRKKEEQVMADILTLKKFEALSPFEIKDELINLAKRLPGRPNPLSSMPAAAIPIGSLPRHGKGFSCLGSSH